MDNLEKENSQDGYEEELQENIKKELQEENNDVLGTNQSTDDFLIEKTSEESVPNHQENKFEGNLTKRPQKMERPFNPIQHFLINLRNIFAKQKVNKKGQKPLKQPINPKKWSEISITPAPVNKKPHSPFSKKGKVALIKPKKIEVINQPLIPTKKVSFTPQSNYINPIGFTFNTNFFETLLMLIIIIWLLKWLFGFSKYPY